MPAGFFSGFLVEVSRCINEKFTTDALIDVKVLRKAMDIPSSDRSKVIFLAKALQRLADAGYLEFVGRNSPKRYRKRASIPAA